MILLTLLEKIQNFVDEVNQSNSGTYKKQVLQKYFDYDFKRFFSYIFDYDKQFNITSKSILKYENSKQLELLDTYKYDYLFDLLDALNSRKVTGHNAIKTCLDFINDNIKYKDLILKIIDKKLDIGISDTTINKLYPSTVKEFNVALAGKWSEKFPLDDTYFISRKLDGVRCICFYNHPYNIQFYSRQGKEFTTLNVLKEKLSQCKNIPNNTVFDGEICIVDENGNEDFQGIIKEIKRKDYTIKNPCYMIFDVLTKDEFEMKEQSQWLKWRIGNLTSLFNDNELLRTNNFKQVTQYQYTSDTLQMLKEKANKEGWEGLMFRKNVSYKGTRSNDLLKYKEFNENDYKVIDVEVSEVQDVVNGIATKIPAIGALIIEHKGNKVHVGTGLSLEQRKRWLEHPEEIVGSMINVKYFEESLSQDGSYSLRFPVLKGVYGKQRDI